ncbi:MAG: hypothetical protein WDK96_01195 [Candidatus Paceibacterota bacterium]|jgi:hypothetical protein
MKKLKLAFILSVLGLMVIPFATKAASCTTFPAASLSLDPNTPISQLVTAGSQNIGLAKLKITAVNCDITVKGISLYSSPNKNTLKNTLSVLKIYNGGTLLASGTNLDPDEGQAVGIGNFTTPIFLTQRQSVTLTVTGDIKTNASGTLAVGFKDASIWDTTLNTQTPMTEWLTFFPKGNVMTILNTSTSSDDDENDDSKNGNKNEENNEDNDDRNKNNENYGQENSASKQLRNEQRKELKEAKKLTETKERAVKKISAAIERLQKLQDRLQSRITKLDGSKINTVEAKKFLEQSKTKLAEAKVLFESLKNGTVPPTIEQLKTGAKSLEDMLKLSKEFLTNAIESLKASTPKTN